MIKIINTYDQVQALFDDGHFQFENWKAYINSVYENAAPIFTDEAEAYLVSGKYTFEKDFLPIIEAVWKNSKLDILQQSFLTATDGLNERIVQQFGREVDTDLVLYLGLCNAAGRVTTINGRQTVLLGVEKIIELDWETQDSMYALIYHELGHIYHAQHGRLGQASGDSRRNFVWQLFTEGIAMYFEQALVGDLSYFHQGLQWRQWCNAHFSQILADFDQDLATMSRFDQRYFGDWADYCGHGDVGYYLGNQFVHHLMERHSFDELINLDIDRVYGLYLGYVRNFV